MIRNNDSRSGSILTKKIRLVQKSALTYMLWKLMIEALALDMIRKNICIA
jgi:hypothetical protein